MTDKNSLEILDLSCCYDIHPVLKNLHLALPEKTIGCLVGPSGCGKTTLLRCIAGLEPITSGQINLSDQVVSTPQKIVPPHRRKISMVFQDYALFPHLTVEENIGFGLHCLSAKQYRHRIKHMLDLVGLTTQAKVYPHTLSGGQQQRVALARALAVKPKLVLLDEPFSSLDPELRDRLARDIRTILKEEKTTALIVTHDQHEAFAMGDFMGVMYDGKIIQWDTAYNLYHQPINRYVADFIGEGIFIKGRVLKPTAVETELGVLTGDQPVAGKVNEIVDVFLRPDDVIHDDQSPLTAEVVKRQFYGAFFHYTLKLPSGQILLAQVPSHHNHAIGEQIGIKFEIDHLVTFNTISSSND